MTRRLMLTSFCVVLLLSAANPGSAGDAPSPRGLTGHNVRVTVDPSTQADSAVAYNHQAGEYLVVWKDYRDHEDHGTDIWGRRLAADGTRIGRDFRISGAGATGSEETPVAAYDAATDTYLVVWADSRNASVRGFDIYAQRLAGDGTRIGINVRVCDAGATGTDNGPSVAVGAMSRFLVTWTDGRLPLVTVHGRLIAADPNTAPSAAVRLSGPATSLKSDADLAYDPVGGGYLVVWQDDRNDPLSGWDVYGQRVTVVAGTPTRVGPNIRLNDSNADAPDFGVSVAALPSGGGFFAVWNDGRRGAGDDREVFGQRVSASGALLGSNVRVSGSASGWVQHPWVGAVADGGSQQWLVAWIDGRNNPPRGGDIYGQRLGTGGGWLGNNFRVSGAGALGNEYAPEGSAGPSGEWLVTWPDDRRVTTANSDIYAQRVTTGP